jgi:hypothetical protein
VSKTPERTPPAVVEIFESAAFRIGRVARQLFTELPDLPADEVRPMVAATSRYLSAELHISVYDSGDGVRAWAAALGAEVETGLADAGTHGYEYLEIRWPVDGVDVCIAGTRRLSDEEYAALRTGAGEAQ